uniref:PIF-5.3 n=1 Tax=Venturia canescens TaxID=32260 RepID=A0A0U1ZI76_9HYME|nr:PIF-5.3 [Venturia canescens]
MAAPTDTELRKAQQKVTDFVSKLKTLGGPVKSTSVASTRKWLKHVHIGIPPLDKALRSLRVEKTQGYLTFNGAPSGTLYKMFRAADLTGIMKLSKLKIPIQASDKSMFDELTATNPEKLKREMHEIVTEARRKHPGLNPKTVALRKMPRETKSALKSFGMMDDPFKEWPAWEVSKQGCWMYTTKGARAWCKVREYSCKEEGFSTSLPVNYKSEREFCTKPVNHYNVTLVIMAIVNNNNNADPIKMKLARAVNIQTRYLSDKLKQMIDTQFAVLEDFVKELHRRNELPVFHICGEKHYAIKEDPDAACRMCDSKASPKSPQYSDVSQWPRDIAFTCITGNREWDALNVTRDGLGGSEMDATRDRMCIGLSGNQKAISSGIYAISTSTLCGKIGVFIGAGCGASALGKASLEKRASGQGSCGQSSGRVSSK